MDTGDFPDRAQLIDIVPLQPIGDDEELAATQARIHRLLDGKPLSQGDRDYLKILGMLVYEYEEIHEPMPTLAGTALLQALLDEAKLQPDQITALFGSEANLSAILNQQQDLTVKQIQTLAQVFHVRPELFLEHPASGSQNLGDNEG